MKKILRLILCLSILVGSSLLFSGCNDEIILVTGVDLYTNEIYADVDESFDLSYKVYPSNASNKKVSFWSTDENVASVDDAGKVTIKSAGEASIVVRSVDGGFEDYCKIITNIDPEKLAWEESDKLILIEGDGYSAIGSMALNQIMKLKLDYLIEGQDSKLVTNKDVTFTSSNGNIQVINDKEGIIKAVNNEIVEGERAYSDITATLQTANGELTCVCRIFVNEYSSINNLYVNYKNGDMQVLNQRNGTETIYLTSGGDAVEFYAYMTNVSGVVKTDYDMSITAGGDKFEVQIISQNKGIYHFKLIPNENEGPATLYLRTSCSDESGKTIRCHINVMVQAEIKSATASATQRTADEREVLLNGEIFGLQLTYFDEFGNLIDGAVRDIYFDPLDEVTSQYISNYGNNQFKVKAVPNEQTQIFTITGYFYVENVETSGKVAFSYNFYLRNSLESLIVSEKPKGAGGVIPSVGVSSITLPADGEMWLYAYATTYDFSLTEPARVNVRAEDMTIVGVATGGDNQYLIRSTGKQGVTKLIFMATDGIETIEYEVTVYVVASVADISLYTGYDASGNMTGKLSANTYNVGAGETTLRLMIQIEAVSSDFVIECESAIAVTTSVGTIGEVVCAGKVLRYIDIDLTKLSAGMNTIVLTADRVLASTILVINK